MAHRLTLTHWIAHRPDPSAWWLQPTIIIEAFSACDCGFVGNIVNNPRQAVLEYSEHLAEDGPEEEWSV